MYAVRKRCDKQYTFVLGHRFSGDQQRGRASAETFGTGRYRLAADAGRFSRIPDRFTRENLQSDLDNLYNLGVGLATAGASNLGDALLPESMFHNLLSGKVSEIANLYDHYSGLFEEAEQGIGNLLLDKIGGPDNVAGLFEFGDYDLAGWTSDYIDDEAGTYYTQRWYIARRDQGSVSLCDYYPPTDDNSILNGGEWTRFETSDPGFIPMPRSGNRLSQLGTICRMVEKPCTAAQQPE